MTPLNYRTGGGCIVRGAVVGRRTGGLPPTFNTAANSKLKMGALGLFNGGWLAGLSAQTWMRLKILVNTSLEFYIINVWGSLIRRSESFSAQLLKGDFSRFSLFQRVGFRRIPILQKGIFILLVFLPISLRVVLRTPYDNAEPRPILSKIVEFSGGCAFCIFNLER